MSDDLSMRRTSFHASSSLVFPPTVSTDFPSRCTFNAFPLDNKTVCKRRRSMQVVRLFLASLAGCSAVQHGRSGRDKDPSVLRFRTALPIGLGRFIAFGHRDAARGNFRPHRLMDSGFVFQSQVSNLGACIASPTFLRCGSSVMR